jgi:hypothetical protein
MGECRLEFVKRLLGLDGPRETLVLLHEPVEGQALFAEPRMKCLNAARHPNTF